MSSWGKAHASASNKPKFAPVDENAPDNRGDIYATNQGWVRAAGTIGSGNDNPNAQPEVLVAIGGLAGTSATTGLRTPTITRTRFIVGTTANTDFTANDANFECNVEITFDEQVTVTGSPTLTVTNGDQSGGGYGSLTLAYQSATSSANQLRFRKTSGGAGTTDVLTVSTLNLNGGTIRDTAAAAAGNTVNATLTYASGIAVSKTVSS